MLETNIEEDIKAIRKLTGYFEFFIKTIIEDKRFAEIKEKNGITEQKYKKTSFSKAIENILADRERLEKENEELLEVKISTSANNRIEELERDNFKLKDELENKRKEYQETYKDVREELKELQAKANKYDALIEKMKEKLNEEELPLVIVGGRRNSKTLNYGIKLGRKQALQELIDTEEE